MSTDEEDSSSGEEEATYEVERILAQEVYDGGQTLYLVKWRGYPDEECTWEPAEHFSTPDTLIEWKRQYEMGDYLDDERVRDLQARMNAWALDRQEQQRKKAEEKKSRARARVTSRIPTIAQSQKTRSVSAEPPLKRPRLQNPAASNQQEADTPHNIGSRIPSTFHKKGIATVTKRSNSTSATHTAATGTRFKNLRHQNNFAERSRQEPAPDVSKLDLKGPDEFLKDDHATAETRKTPPKDRDDSPLFVPEVAPPDPDEVVLQSVTAMPLHPPKPSLEPPTEPSIEPITEPVVEPPIKPSLEQPTEPPIEQPTEPPIEPPTQPPDKPRTKPPVELPTEPPVEPPLEAPPEPPTEPQDMRSAEPPAEPPSNTSSCPASTAQPMTQTSSEPAKASPVQSNSISQPRSLIRPDVTKRDSFAAPFIPSEVPESDSDIRSQGLPRQLYIARNGRAWNRGDLVVHLRFGDHTVGDVKILHLPGKFVANMVTLKSFGELTLIIHFQERYVIKRPDFINKFESNLERFTYALGAIEPYEDTSQAVASLAEHLESNNLGAVWEWPNDVEGFVMILYSCKAPGWSGHGQKSISSGESRLHVMVRNKLPGFRLDDWFPPWAAEPLSSKDSATGSDAVALYNGMTTRGDLTRRPSSSTSQRDILPRIATERNASISKHNGAYVGSPSEAPTISKDRSQSTRSPRTPMTPGSPSQQGSRLPHDLKQKVASVTSSGTKLTFSANFKELVGSDREKKRPLFYIAFARSHPTEAQAVTRWLTEQPSITTRHIYADTEKKAWGEMREEIDLSKSKHGIVLFLEGTQAYCDLKSLAKWVREVACFSISFQQPGGSLGNSITRLFPKGMVMFITESTMIEFPQEVLFLLKWFEEQCRLKPKSRKLGLIPNAKEWITKNCLIRGRSMEKIYMNMLVAICRLKIRAFAAWNSSPREVDPDRYVADVSPGEDDLFLLSMPNLPGYGDVNSSFSMVMNEVAARDRILIQYFCGWAALRVGKYKSFDLLDEHQTNEMVPHSWHVAFRKPKACVETMKRSG